MSIKEYETYGQTPLIPLGSWESRGDVNSSAIEQSATSTEKLKMASIPEWPWVKWDGETATVLNNVQTAFRLVLQSGKPKQLFMRTSFHQYNNTQNDKKNHRGFFEIALLGSLGQVIGRPRYSPFNIVRDKCRSDMSNPVATPEVDIDVDLYDHITTVHYNWYLWWEYEGRC